MEPNLVTLYYNILGDPENPKPARSLKRASKKADRSQLSMIDNESRYSYFPR